MNDDIIEDFKQFVSAEIRQQTNTIREDIDKIDKKVDKIEVKVDKLEVKVDKLEVKVDDIDQKTDAILEAVGERFDDHETKIKKLEQSAR